MDVSELLSGFIGAALGAVVGGWATLRAASRSYRAVLLAENYGRRLESRHSAYCQLVEWLAETPSRDRALRDWDPGNKGVKASLFGDRSVGLGVQALRTLSRQIDLSPEREKYLLALAMRIAELLQTVIGIEVNEDDETYRVRLSDERKRLATLADDVLQCALRIAAKRDMPERESGRSPSSGLR